MAKFFIILASLLALISSCHALIMPFPETSNSDCGSIMTDMAECVPYFLEDQSQPDDLCCAAIESVVATDAGCICETMGSDDLPLDVTKAMALPTLCGVALPCDVLASPAPSPANAPGPHGAENLVPSLAPESESPAQSPSEPSPKPGPSHAPNSPLLPPTPRPTRSSASLAAHPQSISVAVLVSVLFVYFY